MNILEIPKAELHCHLELTLRPETIKELAPQFGIEIPDEKTFKERFLIEEPMADLGAVLNKFLDTQKLLASEEILERITYECLEDSYKQGIKLIELRYAPTFVKLNHNNLSFDSIHQAIIKGMNKASSEFGVATGLVCIIQRTLPVNEAEAVTQFAIDNKDTFIGLDLADNEVGFDSKPFSPFFMRAKEAGLGITVHSGEADVPKAPRYVKDAIDYLGATRIGHGLQIHRDPEMIEYVKEKNIVLELCPTSNWLTNAVATTKEHPIKKLMDSGVKVCINTDDPGIFGIDLIHEYKLLAEEHGFSAEDFAKCNRTAFEASFIRDKDKVANFFN